MPKLLTILFAFIIATAGVAHVPTIEQRLAALEADSAAIKAHVGLKPATRPATVPVVLPGIVDPIKSPGARLTASYDAGGKRYELNKGANIELAAGTLSRLTIATQLGNESVTLSGKGATLADVTFTDGGGFLIKVNGVDNTIRNMREGVSDSYAIYAEGARNLTIDGLYVNGGSTNQSIVRYEGSTGVLRNFEINYTTPTRKAAIRGDFIGLIENGIVRGAVVGPNVLEGDDGSQTLSWWKFLGRYGFKDAINPNDCIAAVRAAIARGVTDQVELCKIAAAVGKVEIDDPANRGKKIIVSATLACDVQATIKRRVSDMGKRSDVTFRNVVLINAPIRWSAGSRYVYQGGRIEGAEIFHNPSSVYPEPKYLLPGDIARPAPDITFSGTAFVSTMAEADFLAQAKRLGVKLKGCTYNRKPIGDSVALMMWMREDELPHVMDSWQHNDGAARPWDVFTDTTAHGSPMDVAQGRMAIDKLVKWTNGVGLVLDVEDAFDGERAKRYATRLRAVRRELRSRGILAPVSAYENVPSRPYHNRTAYIVEMAKRGVNLSQPWHHEVNGKLVLGQRWTIEQMIDPGFRFDFDDTDFAARKILLDASDWAVVPFYFLNDATEPHHDLAGPYVMGRICAELAPNKPRVAYVNPTLYTPNMKPVGLVEMARWQRLIAGLHDAGWHVVFFGHVSEYPNGEERPYWEALKVDAEKREAIKPLHLPAKRAA